MMTLNCTLHINIKRPGIVTHVCNPGSRGKDGRSLGFASQRLWSNHWAQVQWKTLSQKIDMDQARHPKFISGLCMHAYTHVHICARERHAYEHVHTLSITITVSWQVSSSLWPLSSLHLLGGRNTCLIAAQGTKASEQTEARSALEH